MNNMDYRTAVLIAIIVFSLSLYAKTEESFQDTGIASWYGAGHDGNRTASGEVFDMKSYTAAHNTIRFGTKVKVTNPANGRSVIVTINDRGPFVDGRIIDLSKAAAAEIGLMRKGIGKVRIEVINE